MAPRCGWGGWATKAMRSPARRSATTASTATCRLAARSAHAALSRLRSHLASSTRAASTTSCRRRCCRSRTSSTARSGPSACQSAPASARCRNARRRERGVDYVEVRLMDLDPFGSGGHQGADPDHAPSRRVPAALHAVGQPGRHAAGNFGAGAQPAPHRRLRPPAAGPGAGAPTAAETCKLADWGAEIVCRVSSRMAAAAR